MKVAVGVFENRADAEKAIEDLHRAGFRDSQIGIVAREKGRVTKKTSKGEETHAGEGAAAGAVAGAGVGALVGLGIAAGVIPVIGPAIAGGTLAVVLANAAGGAALAGAAGALIGLGIPEDDAKYYERELKAGRTIVTVRATTRLEEAREILRRHHGYDTSKTAATATSARTRAATAATSEAGATAAEGRTVELHEEELEARKRPVKAGEVKVRKDVVTEHKTLDVPVSREEVVIERRPAGRRAASSAEIREGEEIRVPVHGEEVSVQNTPVVREEVSVGKRQVRDTERVSGTVRKEEARVESEGRIEVADTGTRTRVRPRKS
jgi:uncharacterized protein (TIGR02271 family)